MISKEQRTRLTVFTTASLALFFLFVALLVVPMLKSRGLRYVINFSGTSVNGLVTSAPVKYQGGEVGKVFDISVHPDDLASIRVELELERFVELVLRTKRLRDSVVGLEDVRGPRIERFVLLEQPARFGGLLLFLGDPAEAEAQVLHAMRQWAQDAGLGRGQVQTVRIAGKGRFSEIEFQTSYSGTMRGIMQLLWQIESAGIPIRVVKLQIGSRKEGQDDLNLELRLSTIYAPGKTAPARAGGG
ncbi:MAG: MlaD family protein [candidate division NC10 bacterium]